MSRGRVAPWVVVLLVLAVAGGGLVYWRSAPVAPTTTTTTTTTIAPSAPQVGWSVASRNARGVLVDDRMIHFGGAWFRVIRLRARTTLLRWHIGSQDPPVSAGAIPADAQSAIDWATEGPPGVVAVFNGGFKVAAKAGGEMVDGTVIVPPVTGDATIAINAAGHWAMGVWGKSFPRPGFHPIAYRQNLTPLVAHGQITALAGGLNILAWGSPLHNVPAQPRTALGEDAAGNLIDVGTEAAVTPDQLAQVMVKAGAVFALELDMNPYWPIIGASFAPLHHPGLFPVQIPRAQHSPTIYSTGWQRDFFIALAEPNSWYCHWSSPGLVGTRAAQPQPLTLIGRDCQGTVTTTTSPSS